jgi:glucose-6-phosphate isomerase
VPAPFVELRLQIGDGGIEHLAMGRRGRGVALGPRARKGQLQRVAAAAGFALRGRQRPLDLGPPLGFRLLELDVLALEPSGHSVKYSSGMEALSGKRARLRESLTFAPGPIADLVKASTHAAERAAGGLWRREPAAWSDDPSVQAIIANRLGWLGSPATMASSIDRLRTFAAGVRKDVTDVVLLGMGGSSLAPEVLRAVVGVAPGWPAFRMLDSTDPAAVRAADTPPASTLYIVASKSGTTIEPSSLAAHFRKRLIDAGVARWAGHFVAITDDGTALHRQARAEGFRDVFVNPSDIGGRYSALSFFGLVPAALMGQDVAAILDWAMAMLAASEPGFGDALSNPAVGLGLAMGAAARAGRDKLTLVLPPALEPFGLWVEQLIAESTGKHATGIVPIAGEPPAPPSAYGSDRLFVRLASPGPAKRESLPDGAPTIEIDVPEPAALGAEFVRWEIATAIAGALLQINPFDEPNVQQAKDATRALLGRYTAEQRLPVPPADRTLDNGVALTLSQAARRYVRGGDPASLLSVVRQGDYFALLAFVGFDDTLARELGAFRTAVRDRTRAATMFGYGPRYLHSTGQLHKGGPNTGVFLVISATPREDVPIPGEPFSFGTLELAQALGDFQSLDATERRALHAHLPSQDPALVHALGELLLSGYRP